MALRRIRSWRASASDMASGLLSHILVEPSMSVNRKVTVPVGGLATTSTSSFFPSGDTIAAGRFLDSLIAPSARRRSAAFAEVANPVRTNLSEGDRGGSNPRPPLEPQSADIRLCVLLDVQNRGDPRRLSARLQAALSGVRVVSE